MDERAEWVTAIETSLEQLRAEAEGSARALVLSDAAEEIRGRTVSTKTLRRQPDGELSRSQTSDADLLALDLALDPDAGFGSSSDEASLASEREKRPSMSSAS